jgi:hypothetical protein
MGLMWFSEQTKIISLNSFNEVAVRCVCVCVCVCVLRYELFFTYHLGSSCRGSF